MKVRSPLAQHFRILPSKDYRLRPDETFLKYGVSFSSNLWITYAKLETITFDQADFTHIKYGLTLNYGEYINFSKSLGLCTLIDEGILLKENIYSNLRNPSAVQFDNSFLEDLYKIESFHSVLNSM